MRSFLRRAPRDSSRTRAVAGGRHVEHHLATGHKPLCQVMTQPFGVLHRPLPLWPLTWPRPSSAGSRPAVASTRSEPRLVLVTGSTAVAVCVLLCGSTPMTIMDNGFPFSRCNGGSAADNPTSSHLARTCGHASLQSRREREPEGSTHPLESQPEYQVTGTSRVRPSGSLRHATGGQPDHEPLTRI